MVNLKWYILKSVLYYYPASSINNITYHSLAQQIRICTYTHRVEIYQGEVIKPEMEPIRVRARFLN